MSNLLALEKELLKELPSELVDMLETFDYLRKTLECQNKRTINMKEGLENLLIGACTCVIKHPDMENHAEHCHYKKVSVILKKDEEILREFDLDKLINFLKSRDK